MVQSPGVLRGSGPDPAGVRGPVGRVRVHVAMGGGQIDASGACLIQDGAMVGIAADPALGWRHLSSQPLPGGGLLHELALPAQGTVAAPLRVRAIAGDDPETRPWWLADAAAPLEPAP